MGWDVSRQERFGLPVCGVSSAGTSAENIALILNTTLMGLLIAIPSLVFWSYYSKKVENLAIEMETLSDEFIRRQYRGEPAPPAPPAPPAAGGPERARKAK